MATEIVVLKAYGGQNWNKISANSRNINQYTGSYDRIPDKHKSVNFLVSYVTCFLKAWALDIFALVIN